MSVKRVELLGVKFLRAKPECTKRMMSRQISAFSLKTRVSSYASKVSESDHVSDTNVN